MDDFRHRSIILYYLYMCVVLLICWSFM